MKCSFCGAEAPAGSPKCPVCGAPMNSENVFSNSSASGTAEQVRCTACGAMLPAGTRFCPQCGNSLYGLSDETKNRMQQQKDDFWNEVESDARAQRKSRRRGALVSWALRLVGLGAAAYLIYYIST